MTAQTARNLDTARLLGMRHSLQCQANRTQDTHTRDIAVRAVWVIQIELERRGMLV